jgi:hypothetical protein
VKVSAVFDLPLQRVYVKYTPHDAGKDTNTDVNVDASAAVGGRVVGHQEEEWVLPMDKVCVIVGEARASADGAVCIAAPRHRRHAGKPFVIRQGLTKESIAAEAESAASAVRLHECVFELRLP